MESFSQVCLVTTTLLLLQLLSKIKDKNRRNKYFRIAMKTGSEVKGFPLKLC